jgi:CDP-glucose 4,6-dehydratase
MEFLPSGAIRALNGPILITGHTGFKGAWLSLFLRKLNIETVGLSLPPEQDSLYMKLSNFDAKSEIIGDIRNIALVEHAFKEFKPSAVIHLAAQPLVLESYKAPLETFAINVMGTANILDVAQRSGSAEVVISVTTDKVYRNEESGSRFIETDPLEGKDPYSASKVGSEAVISAWQQISKVSGGPRITSVRAGNVIGGGDWSKDRLVPDLIRGYISKTKVDVRNPEGSRPWQHVLDPLTGYLKALDVALTSKVGSSYNFGPADSNLSVREVCNLMSNFLDSENLVSFSKVDKKENLEAHTLNLSSDKASRELDWKPKWSQFDAVRLTSEWWASFLSGKSANDCCEIDIGLFLEDDI